ncbi:two-component system sensor histidine kinase LytS [Aequitasia blattaphilus]|uniref:Histidine kinase n=1 Tax=Aequitasia blattaphilus TaxID=2949332 RepID=A0ABT1EF52_9FIRM|nr:LytS/YhcK type 5TM receptor domain-containing protein [Aequitasia blattaphilus]MCP1103087.1 histidine kinase [Aequitasia blattaphilus]MCR8615727.1 histidine kinase [Aequitasia blattaphilus]
MSLPIFERILFNISMLILLAGLLTKLQPVRQFLSEGKQTKKSQILLALLFGGIGIIATYTGIPVEGAIANVRVIGVVSAGILGGPVVGGLAGIVAGVHRYVIDVHGITAVACAISTVMEGLIGGLLSNRLRYAKRRSLWVGATACLVEIMQMILILLIAKPFEEAWKLVKLISVPMILFNSLGVVLFIGLFDAVLNEQSRAAAMRIKLAFQIAERCLPYLRKGFYDVKELQGAMDIILEMSGLYEVGITDQERILCRAGKDDTSMEADSSLPDIAKQVIEEGDTTKVRTQIYNHQLAICAPLTQKDETIMGTLLLRTNKRGWSQMVESEFARGLARLFSTQLELSQLDQQKALRQKAELEALQSQINPHFLFNALSTITMFCREKPERARELLLSLSSYFRNTLQTGKSMITIYDELEHVRAYVELEKARFGEKLVVSEDIPKDLNCILPAFTLQPIVENAIKHGAMKQAGVGRVKISAYRTQKETVILVRDNGPGIPSQVVRNLYENNMSDESVGLTNVYNRLKNIYGEKNCFIVESGNYGGVVTIRIPTLARGTT